MMRLRGYGNAINADLATAFLMACREELENEGGEFEI
jgi:hypothetical protein